MLTLEEQKAHVALLAEFQQSIAVTKIRTYRPYPWQLEFHEAGMTCVERMLMAANRVGKTLSAGAETSYHLTGLYPDWWRGIRFDKPVLCWTGSPTNETSRDIVQKELLGGLGEELGTGWVPRHLIVGKPQTRQAGVKNVVESFQVRHVSGGLSTCNLKTYEMGWEKWQGTAPDLVWLDEEPADYKIFTECQTRIITSRGRLMVTFTPLRGETQLVLYFLKALPGTFFKGATWADAPHLDEKTRAEFTARYPSHEVDARTKGIPMLGEGVVFNVDDATITVEPFEIPSYYARIKGCDFGLDHPAAGADLAIDRDTDTVYLVDCYKKAQELAPYHAAWFTKSNKWVPVSWPHDGLNREKNGGKQLKDRYRELGVNMLAKSARYPRVSGDTSDKGGPQPVEPIVEELLERMKSGRFKVFKTCTPFFEEKRGYHRANGKLSAVRDDVIKAVGYALMMKRYAATRSSSRSTQQPPGRPIASMR